MSAINKNVTPSYLQKILIRYTHKDILFRTVYIFVLFHLSYVYFYYYIVLCIYMEIVATVHSLHGQYSLWSCFFHIKIFGFYRREHITFSLKIYLPMNSKILKFLYNVIKLLFIRPGWNPGLFKLCSGYKKALHSVV